MSELIPAVELAYMAALVDNLAVLKTRLANGTELPAIALTTTNSRDAVQLLAERSGAKVTQIPREYHRKGCAVHCTVAHLHVDTCGYRWQVTGVKATILLHNLLPYLRVQTDRAHRLIAAGRTLGYSTSVVNRMRELGWDIPKLKAQPRART